VWHAIPAEGGGLIYAEVSPTAFNTRYTRINSNGMELWHVDLPGEAPDEGSVDGRITRLVSGDLFVNFYLGSPKLIRGATGAFVRNYAGPNGGEAYCSAVTSSLRGPIHMRGDQTTFNNADLFDDATGASTFLNLSSAAPMAYPCPTYAMAPDLRSGWARADIQHRITVANAPAAINTSSRTPVGGYSGGAQPVMDANGWLYTITDSMVAQAYEPVNNSYVLRWSRDVTNAGTRCASPMVVDGKVFALCSNDGPGPKLVVLSP
jgi:hypothetical protein